MIGNNNKLQKTYCELHLDELQYKMIYCEVQFGGIEMAEVNTDKWINIDEAAEYLGVKPGTIRDWIRKGKDVPAHKIGKQWKFKCSELDNWVASGKSAME